jgi:hypothetical protein
VVQLYVKYPGVVRELRGFERVPLRAGEKKTVEITVTRATAGEAGLFLGGRGRSCRITP